MSFVGPLIIAAAAMCLVMLLAWVWQWRFGNAGVVDVVWTFSVGALAIACLAFAVEGLPARRIVLAVLIGVWAVRLGGHLLVRTWRSREDERYQQLKATWGRWSNWRLLLFYQAQALSGPLFALPFLVAGQSAAPLHVGDAAGVALWLLAFAGEWQADRQLARFRENSSNRGRVCQDGWWQYSRHPNYFFEWLHWCSYVPFALYSPWWWLSLLPPAAMYYFLNYVTGIPPAEAQSLRSKGEAYRQYQQRTSPFFPWPIRTRQ